MWSSRTTDRTHVPCIGRWILNHWTAKEVPTMNILNNFLICLISFLLTYLLWGWLSWGRCGCAVFIRLLGVTALWFWRFWDPVTFWYLGESLVFICLQRKLKGCNTLRWPKEQMLQQWVALGNHRHESGISFWATEGPGSEGRLWGATLMLPASSGCPILYWICYSIASDLCFGFLALWHVGS